MFHYIEAKILDNHVNSPSSQFDEQVHGWVQLHAIVCEQFGVFELFAIPDQSLMSDWHFLPCLDLLLNLPYLRRSCDLKSGCLSC
jgi:hypothetical protein